MVHTFKKCVFYLIALFATLTGGCCYPSHRYLPFKIEGIVQDSSGNPIQNEKIVVPVSFFGREEEIVSLTDQEGIFSCDAFITDAFAVCFIPPTFLLGYLLDLPKEPHFTISIPNRSKYDYKIDFPRKKFRCKKIDRLPSNQNTHIGDKEIEIQGVMRVTKDLPDFYAIIELDMVVNNKSSSSK